LLKEKKKKKKEQQSKGGGLHDVLQSHAPFLKHVKENPKQTNQTETIVTSIKKELLLYSY